MKRLHLIDGTYELFRAHFSKRPDHRAPDGRDLKATLGLASSMLWLLHEDAEAVSHAAIAFDRPIRSFRNELFAGYKSDEGVPEELAAQFLDAEEAARAIGLTVWTMDRWEADDAMATGAHRFAPEVDQVRLLSPDKDVAQCLNGERVVQVYRSQERVVTEASFRKERGFGPTSVPDFLALVGDTADGIPGLKGFGDKTSAALLGRYGSLEAIPLDEKKWEVPVRGAAKLAETLREHLEEAKLYRKLATLVTDVPLKEDLEALRYKGVPQEAFYAWCDRVGAKSLRERPKRWTE